MNKFREQEAKRREREQVKAAKDVLSRTGGWKKRIPTGHLKTWAIPHIELPAPVPRPRARPWNKGKARTATQPEPGW